MEPMRQRRHTRDSGVAEIEQVPSPEWPASQNRPIAVLDLEPDEIEKRFSLIFTDERDDLDSLRLAVVKAPSGRVFGLARYDRSPTPGTTIYSNEASSADEDIEEFLRAFGLEPDRLSWRVATAAQATGPE
jgi:hypothetical protein